LNFKKMWGKRGGEDEKKKCGKLLTSHCSTIYPCFLPDLGEFNRS
jgi:hypothetical protein